MLHSGEEMRETNTAENLSKVALYVNCTVEDTQEMADCLREKTPDELRLAADRCQEVSALLGGACATPNE